MSEETNSEKGQRSRMDINNMARKLSRGNKTGGIIIAVCMVILGVLLLIQPIASAVGLSYIVTIGFIVYGVFQIIAYFRVAPESRNGWALASGIVYTLCGVMILIDSFGGLQGKINMISTLAFIIGFFALMGGITQISSYGAFSRAGEPGSGCVLASGIINLVLGILIIVAPIAGFLTIQVIFSVYLIVGGIALFAEACSGKIAYKG